MAMSASRLIVFTSSLVVRTTHRAALAQPILHTKLFNFSYQALQFSPTLFHSRIAESLRRRNCSSAAAAVDGRGEAAAVGPHPWPEWTEFVDRLKKKGYLGEETAAAASEEESSGGRSDLNLLKNACLSFARDRFDVFKSLSREDIQTVVEYGCPNLLRKVVNSSKRLRAHVGLDEGEVCGACNLRGSCDRAYVLLKESEAAARTIDLVRMLMIYALDPLVLAGEEKPHGREQIEASARKLLSQLNELSEMPIDPALPSPAQILQREKKRINHVADLEQPQNVEMKRGDWICSKFHGDVLAHSQAEMLCPTLELVHGLRKTGYVPCTRQRTFEEQLYCWCNFMNFARNLQCLKCKEDGPKRVSSDDIEMKKGDWTCPQCQFMNFARNRKCKRCEQSRPERQLNPGEWECPSCDFLNYRRNMVCLKCNCERPKGAKGEAAQFEEHIWRSPR
ncbi:hypothetical protein Sjap_014718 [Stephania japonica]|uniref:RanBP2-type domain-containing protein n=1 Tax=Stephania japonica TaxID=461633 RepID=A0AAP0IJB3_9MAGN